MKSIYVLIGVSAVLGGCTTLTHDHAEAEPAIPAVNVEQVAVQSESRADRLIAKAKGQIKANPENAKAYALLGTGLMQRARDEGQLADYNAAHTAFTQATKLDPKNPTYMRSLAWSSTMFHRFGQAIELCEKALEINPQDASAYGILTDSYFELGDYDKAMDMCQKMVNLRPDLASYSRVAQMRWVMGDVKGATTMMNHAVKAGGGFPENIAWTRTQLGDMYAKSGAYKPAEQQFLLAIQAKPGYRHALAGLGRVRFAEGKPDEALKYLEEATSKEPSLPALLDLGDLYRLTGNEEKAKETYGRFEGLIKEHLKHGILGDEVMQANFALDRGGDVEEALRLMETEVQGHKNWQTYSAYAWALHKSHRHEEAAKAMKKAMRTNVQDAQLFARASNIYRANGEVEKATKFAIAAHTLNPGFDILGVHSEKQALQ
jgi:pentatricopeptide repeat protein